MVRFCGVGLRGCVPFLLASACLLPVADGRADVITVTSQSQLPGVFSSALPSGSSITVSGFAAGNNYNADGHVVPIGGKSGVGNLLSYNGKDFIINDSARSDRITLDLSFKINSISFDFEIFPDGTANQPPDFTFTANGRQYLYATGVKPPGGQDPNAQFVGSSNTILLPDVNHVEFVDWPATIGVNNITFAVTPALTPQGDPVVPEPGSLALFSLVLLGGVGARRWRRRKIAG